MKVLSWLRPGNGGSVPRPWLIYVAALSSVAALPVSTPLVAAEYEAPPTLTAQSLFPETPLAGDGYRVKPQVPTDGFLTRAVIQSDLGEFIAVGPGMLAVRLHELDALRKLQDLEDSDEFQRGLKESASEKASGVKKLVENPKEAMQGIGEGVGRFFKRTARAARTGAQKAGDVLADRVPGQSDELENAADMPGRNLDEPTGEVGNKYVAAAQATGDAALNILGFDDARRRLAKRLVVDPYTTNPVLDEKLDAVARSLFAGDLAVDVATALIPGGAIVSSSNLVTDWVWDTPPGDLRVKVEATLLDLGVDQEDIDRLLRHQWYPLSFQAALSVGLAALDGVEGRAGVMPMVLSAGTVDQARFVVNTVRMLVRYHKTVEPIESLALHGTVSARTRSGATVVAAPVDYVSWTPVMERFSGREEFSGLDKTLHIPGNATELTQEKLAERGWQLVENSALLVRERKESNL